MKRDDVWVRSFVWVDSWQQQCCGQGFAVGSTVTWQVRPQSEFDADWVRLLLGDAWADRVEYHEEHHDEVQRPTLTGEVVSIRVVTCNREAQPQGAGALLMPVRGSGKLREVQAADPWEPEPPASRMDQESFDGWIVELALSPLASQ